MIHKEIQLSYAKITDLLIEKRVVDALHLLQIKAQETHNATFTEECRAMKENYNSMLQYFIKGVEDPQRKEVLFRLIKKALTINAQLNEGLLTQHSSSTEFTQKRSFAQKETIPQQKIYQYLGLESTQENEKIDQQANVELATDYLFNAFWLTSDYSRKGLNELFQQLFSTTQNIPLTQSIIVSAITLNLIRNFDENRVLMLLEAMENREPMVAQRAMVGLCFVLTKYNKILPYFGKINSRLSLAADDKYWVEAMRYIITQIISTTETEEITKRLQEEILPELMKLKPLIDKELNQGNRVSDDDEWEEKNPQWEEMIKDSGASEKIQEFAKLQESGADVYLSTFSTLKQFPFFNTLSNWFMPFDSKQSAVKEVFADNNKKILTTILKSGTMCNSDSYSFCLSLTQMPQTQQEMMKRSFAEAAEQLKEMKKEEQLFSPREEEKNSARLYIQDLFRFYKLHPQSSGFVNIFRYSLSLHKTNFIKIIGENNDLKKQIAEYYFSQKHYQQAYDIFADPLEIAKYGNQAEYYQKLGFALQQNLRWKEALSAYLKADLIDADDFWTVKKIAFCYRMLKDYENALTFYQNADRIEKGDLAVKLQIVNCLLELKKTDKTIALLLQIDNEFPDNIKVWRTIVFTALHIRNISQANYYNILVLDTPNINNFDLLMAAFIAWLQDNTKSSFTHFRKILANINHKWNFFVELFEANREILLKNGVEDEEIVLMLDVIKSDINI